MEFHIVKLVDMFLYYHKYGHCSLFLLCPTYTILVPNTHQMCINSRLKIFPSKYTATPI